MMTTDRRIVDLSNVPLFSDCSPKELADIARLVDRVTLRAGDVIVREGKTGHECFVIADGEAVVTIKGKPIAWVGRGDIIGEMALVEQEPRVATVTCASDVSTYVMTSQAFATVIDHCPSVARKVLATLAHRLRDIQAA